MGYNFGCMILATRCLILGECFSGSSNEDSRDRVSKGRCHGNHFWLSLYMGCTLAPHGEYDWAVHVRRRCGLISNYFDHL